MKSSIKLYEKGTDRHMYALGTWVHPPPPKKRIVCVLPFFVFNSAGEKKKDKLFPRTKVKASANCLSP
jgi:hypothetical protein